MPVFTFDAVKAMIGTFIKTDSLQVVEILGLCNLDFAVLDAEHAPFDRCMIDHMVFAARAVEMPMLVRIPDHQNATIQSVLDSGACGIVVPHVDSAAEAQGVLAAARFRGGRRGLSLSPRFAGYGTRAREAAIADADQTLVVCQIESRAAVESVEEIAAIAGLGGLLVGRLDLAISFGQESPRHPAIQEAVRHIVAAARLHNMPVLVACGGENEVAELTAEGFTKFIVGSDQSLLLSAATGLRGMIKTFQS